MATQCSKDFHLCLIWGFGCFTLVGERDVFELCTLQEKYNFGWFEFCNLLSNRNICITQLNELRFWCLLHILKTPSLPACYSMVSLTHRYITVLSSSFCSYFGAKLSFERNQVIWYRQCTKIVNYITDQNIIYSSWTHFIWCNDLTLLVGLMLCWY